MSVAAEVGAILAKKNRAAGFEGYVKKQLEGCETARTWEEFDAAVDGSWCETVASVLHLVPVKGQTDPAVLQLRTMLEAADDLKYFALRAARAVIADDAAAASTESKKRKFDATTESPVLSNVIALLHGLVVPKNKKDPINMFFADTLQRLRDEAKGLDNAPGLTAKQRNKRGKEGVLQLFAATCHQRVFSDMWLACVGSPRLSKAQLLSILETLHEDVMPYLSSPLSLFDFLSDAYNHGGYAGILSLNSLFVLIVEHGLEYPAFFDKLYQLLTPDVCAMKYRGRFFELVGKFLRSVNLSAAVVAAFVKRACRLALHAPTPAVFFLISLVKLLLIRHPQVMPLIHRKYEPTQAGDDEEDEAAAEDDANEEESDSAQSNNADVWQGVDPYDFNEPDPSESRAIDSSCWELRALLDHYNPTISSTAKELCDELKQPLGGAEPILTSRAGRTFTRMVQRELLREIKGVPTSAYGDPKPFAGASAGALAAAFSFPTTEEAEGSEGEAAPQKGGKKKEKPSKRKRTE